MSDFIRVNCMGCILSVLLGLGVCPAQVRDGLPAGETELNSRIDQLFVDWNDPGSAGCVVGVIREGQMVHSRGYGSANLSDEVANTPHSVFALASFSKSVTCACLAILMDQGKIDANEDIRQYIPELHDFNPPVRIRHMVRCHSGLWAQFHILPLAGFDNVPIHSPYSKEDVFTILTGQSKLPFEPGSEFQYGSGEYFFLAVLIERVSGKTLAEFANEQIFKPLGMSGTFYDEDPTRVVKGRALAYFKDQDGVTREWRNHGYLAGGGGLNSCLVDLYKWDQNFVDNQLPSGEHLDRFIRDGELLGNRFCLDADAYRKKVHEHPDNAPAAYYRGLRRIQFTGGWWGMTAAMARYPEQATTIICLSNNDDLSALRFATRIADVVLADELETVNDDPTEEIVVVPKSELENKVGAYQLEDNKFIYRVSTTDDGLELTDRLDNSYQLKPVAVNRFRPVGKTPFYKSAIFEFIKDGEGPRYEMFLRTHEGQVFENLRIRPVELVDPPGTSLPQYAGEYVSDELGSTYRITADDEAIWLRINSRHRERLEPTLRDQFVARKRHPHDGRTFRFLRDADGRVAGLDVRFWRIRSLEFERR